MIAKEIERRVALARAIRTYLKTRERLHQANAEFAKACNELRAQADCKQRCVALIDNRFWLFEIDEQGNFDLLEIELL